MRNRFVFYNLSTDEVYGLSKEMVQVKKRLSNVHSAPITVTLDAVPVTFHANMLRVDLLWFGRITMNNDGRLVVRGEAELAGSSGGVDFDALLENNVLFAEAVDTLAIQKETLPAVISLVGAVRYEVRVS